MEPVTAVELSLLVLELITRGFASAAQVKAVLEPARAEGRDITDEELDILKSFRKDALAAWRDAD